MGDLPLAAFASAPTAAPTAYTPPMGQGPSSIPSLNAAYQDPSTTPAAPAKLPMAAFAGGAAPATPAAPTTTPYNFKLADFQPSTLQQVAKDAGINVANVAPDYWNTISQHYQDATDPGTLGKIHQFIASSGVGHFGQGMDAAGASDSMDNSTLARISPMMAETQKADQFFNKNIQAQIIDGGKYVDAKGNYNPPDSYKAGALAGTLGVGDPGAMAAGGAALKAGSSLAGTAAKAVSGFIADHPIAGKVVERMIEGTALGAAVKYLPQMVGVKP